MFIYIYVIYNLYMLMLFIILFFEKHQSINLNYNKLYILCVVELLKNIYLNIIYYFFLQIVILDFLYGVLNFDLLKYQSFKL
jgi:hypothetical protein